MARKTQNVTYASPCIRPHFIKPQRASPGSKGAGVRYERLLGKYLRHAIHGQWFQYIDCGEPFWCQPDFILTGQSRTLVFEVKLTFTPDAHDQIDYLYRPVLEKAYGKPVHGIIVCKNLVNWMPGEEIVDNLTEVMGRSFDRSPVLHWLGRSPP